METISRSLSFLQHISFPPFGLDTQTLCVCVDGCTHFLAFHTHTHTHTLSHSVNMTASLSALGGSLLGWRRTRRHFWQIDRILFWYHYSCLFIFFSLFLSFSHTHTHTSTSHQALQHTVTAVVARRGGGRWTRPPLTLHQPSGLFHQEWLLTPTLWGTRGARSDCGRFFVLSWRENPFGVTARTFYKIKTFWGFI